MHYASFGYESGLIKSLLEKGVDPNIRDNFGVAVLEVAASNIYDLMGELTQLCSCRNKEKAEAYEICALSGNQYSCASVVKRLVKATDIRIELSIVPKSLWNLWNILLT